MEEYKKLGAKYEYIVYDIPLKMHMWDIDEEYPEGGAILGNCQFHDENATVEIKAHLRGRKLQTRFTNEVEFRPQLTKKDFADLVYALPKSDPVWQWFLIQDGGGGMESVKSLLSLNERIRFWMDETPFTDFYGAISERVIGQDALKLVLGNVYNYLSCVAHCQKHNNNSLIAAPSGSGKTETFRALRDYFAKEIPGLPICQVDMTSITLEGFSGGNTIDIVRPLIEAGSQGVGIIFMDELDKKLLPVYSRSGENVNAQVVCQILTLIEGRKISDKPDANGHRAQVDTTNTLFIGVGSFDDFRQKREEKENCMGFKTESEEKENYYTDISRQDIIESGASYELLGRFPSLFNYHKLNRRTVSRIISGIAKEEAGMLGVKEVRLEPGLVRELYLNSEGKYGIRAFRSAIHDRCLEAYVRMLESGESLGDTAIILTADGNFRTEYNRDVTEGQSLVTLK